MKQYCFVLVFIFLFLTACEDREQYVSSSEATSNASESVPQQNIEEIIFDPIITASASVGNSYFNDAVFIGDSISEGISLYKPIEDLVVLAGTGINPSSIFTTPVIKDEEGGRITILDALKEKKPKKIYIMLGSNGINFISVETMIEDYKKLILEIKQNHPDAIIYVQSVLPVTKKNIYQVSNKDIDLFNKELITLCSSQEVYYLDVSSKFKTEDGTLPIETSPNDGMHFGKSYYGVWFDFLKEHTLEGAVYVEGTHDASIWQSPQISDQSVSSEKNTDEQLS